MSEFIAYMQLGFQHITDLKGYDHILFVIALCSVFSIVDLRNVAILVTAFTIGHSVTLALATLNIIKFDSSFIEFLIPITILITAIFNFFHKSTQGKSKVKKENGTLRYILAGCFGLIHGMGFSNYLRSLLGKEESIFKPLLGFNIGLEGGQLLIVLATLLLFYMLTNILKVKKHELNLIVSGIIGGIALMLIMNSDYYLKNILPKL
jgi:hypothetical protein